MLACRRSSFPRTVSPHVTVRRTVHPRRRASSRIDEPTLFQFVVLSMLLHILAIVLFGSTGRGGGVGRSEELLGALDVTLRRLAPEHGAGFRLAPGATDAAPSSAPSLLPRPESASKRLVREKPAGEAPEPAPSETRELIIAPPAETPTPEESVPRLNRSAPEEVDKPLRPSAPERMVPKINTTPERLAPVAPSPIEHELARPIEAPSRIVPIAPAEPLERVAPVLARRALARPAELQPQAVPVTPATPLERLAPPQPGRELAPPVEPLTERPIAPGGLIEHTVAPAIERELSPSVEVPAQAVPSAPIEHVLPPTGERQLTPAAEVRAPPVRTPLPAAEREAAPPRPASSPAAAPRRRPPSDVAPDRSPAVPEALPPSRYGTPAPEEDIFKPRHDTPGEAPRIDLDAAKKRAVREMAHEGSGSVGVLPFPLPVPEKKTKEAKAMEKAIKPDCRTAYAGMGLLAVPALVAAAITDEGCRW